MPLCIENGIVCLCMSLNFRLVVDIQYFLLILCCALLQDKAEGHDPCSIYHHLPENLVPIGGPVQISCDGQTGRYFVWREHGLQLYLPANCAHRRVVVTMNSYVPHRSQLNSKVHIVSSIYYLQTNIKQFSTAVTLHLQHCVKLKTEEDCQKMYYIIHDNDNTTTANGQFHIGHSYGTIEMTSFCYVYIVWKTEGGIVIRSHNDYQQEDGIPEGTANLNLSQNSNLETSSHPPSEGPQNSTNSQKDDCNLPSECYPTPDESNVEESPTGPTFVYEEMLVVPSNRLSLVDKNWNGAYLIYRNLEGWRLVW